MKTFKSFTLTWQLLIVILLSGCTVIGINQASRLNDLYGEEAIHNRTATNETEREVYLEKVKPILDTRCVVCHACYDASCQLKLSSPAGIDRGSSKNPVYDTSVFTRDPSRLFIDAINTEDWRSLDFTSVLNERNQSAEANLESSVLYKMISLKNNHPMQVESNQPITDSSLSFELDTPRECPSIETFPQYARNTPMAGMPYGLPPLNAKENTTINEWLINGAKMTNPTIPASHEKLITKWETFFNGKSYKQQLASRYIYEHLFLAHIYFSESNDSAYYKLVRSSTPPGKPIKQLTMRLPFQDPGSQPFYYRLWLDPETITAKSHLPYAFNEERLAWMKELFIDEPYEVTSMPVYRQDVASNPFIAFEAIPARSRYRFMLEEARYTIMGFIKGPVCRGQIALNSIQDHFWVYFVDPENPITPKLDSFLIQQSHNLKLPGSEGGYSSLLGIWSDYSKKNDTYLRTKFQSIQNYREESSPITIDYIWNGDGKNKNAALTVFRHKDSASVVHGLIGEQPKTAWLIDYPLLERIHYLLVAQFDVYGNLAHQLSTRLYMDFLRQEGEINFLNLFPKAERSKTQKFWYRDTNQALAEHLQRCESLFEISTGLVDIRTDNPQRELYQLTMAHLSPVLEKKYDIFNKQVPKGHRRLLKELENLSGYYLKFFPEIILLTIEEPDGETFLYTILRNNEHSNVTSLFSSEENRLHNEDYLTVVRGVIGDYPSVFMHVNSEDLNDFMTGMVNITSESDYKNMLDHFGIRRTHNEFWQHSDKVHALFKNMDKNEAGLLDYNRLENR